MKIRVLTICGALTALLVAGPRGAAQEQENAAPAAPAAPAPAPAEGAPAPAAGPEAPPPFPGGPGGPRGFRGGPGGPRGFRGGGDFRLRMIEGFKTELKVSDEEWTVIRPLIEKVMEKQRATRGMGNMRRGPGGPGGPGAPGAPAGEGLLAQIPVAGPEGEALRSAILAADTDPKVIQAKVTEFRAARKKVQAEYEQACQELTAALTPRQEALLVLVGVLQ